MFLLLSGSVWINITPFEIGIEAVVIFSFIICMKKNALRGTNWNEYAFQYQLVKQVQTTIHKTIKFTASSRNTYWIMQTNLQRLCRKNNIMYLLTSLPLDYKRPKFSSAKMPWQQTVFYVYQMVPTHLSLNGKHFSATNKTFSTLWLNKSSFLKEKNPEH